MNDRKKTLVLLSLATLLLTGCATHKAASNPATTPLGRAPIREVTEQQLKTDSRLIDALTLQETGHLDEALEAFARLTHDEPSCAAAWYGQGQLLMARHWLDSALHCMQHAVELQDTNVWYLMSLAQLYQLKGDATRLAATGERLVAQRPQVLEYYYSLSNAYLAAGDIQSAVETLNRVERRVGVTEPVSLQKQQIWESVGKHDKALREVEALADAMPQERRYQAMLAEKYMQAKNYRKAKQYYDRILQAHPDDEYIHLQLAEYYKQTKHPAEADSEMVAAFAHPRLDTRTKLQLLTSFYPAETFYSNDVCLRLAQTVLEQSNQAPEACVIYGDLLMHRNRYDEAADLLTRGLAADSTRYTLWEALLISLSQVPAREDDLYTYARRAERLFPMQTLPHYMAGLYALRHERYDEAVTTLEQALKWGFNRGYLEAETYGLLAESYYQNGQHEKAWHMFDRYLALRPDDWGTLNNYAYYLALQGVQLEKAEQMSRRTVDAEPDNANSLDTYAWILHLLGRDREALSYMERAVARDPHNDTLQRHLTTIRAAANSR